jgi:hypothetical protein
MEVERNPSDTSFEDLGVLESSESGDGQFYQHCKKDSSSVALLFLREDMNLESLSPVRSLRSRGLSCGNLPLSLNLRSGQTLESNSKISLPSPEAI